MIIRRIVPLSLAKIAAAIYGGVGLVVGGIFSLVALTGGFNQSNNESANFFGTIAIGAVLVFPIIYALFGFVATFLAAWLYNIAAGVVGGVRIEVE